MFCKPHVFIFLVLMTASKWCLFVHINVTKRFLMFKWFIAASDDNGYECFVSSITTECFISAQAFKHKYLIKMSFSYTVFSFLGLWVQNITTDFTLQFIISQ